MVGIDVFTRKVYAEPMIDKDGGSVREAFIKMTKIVQPKTVMSDFLGNEFSEYLREQQIPLHVNALGEHHALGIIDNFSGIVNRILTALFLNNNSTIWINSVGAIINHYNRSPREALNGISPNDATKKTRESMILDINIVKNRSNKTVSDLSVGDKVRTNILFNDKNSKGIDPKWSGKVITVVKVYGNTITLDDNSKYKRTF